MKIYWTTPIPKELAKLSNQDRRRIWKECYRLGFHKPKTWLGLLICGSCSGLGSFAGDSLDIAIWGSAIGGGIGGFIFGQIAIRSTLEIVRERYGDFLSS